MQYGSTGILQEVRTYVVRPYVHRRLNRWGVKLRKNGTSELRAALKRRIRRLERKEQYWEDQVNSVQRRLDAVAKELDDAIEELDALNRRDSDV